MLETLDFLHLPIRAPQNHKKSGHLFKMLAFVVLTLGLLVLLGVVLAMAKRKEVMDNWPKYRTNPFILLTSFLYKPDKDPRSRLEFSNDNFKEVLTDYVLMSFKLMLEPIFNIFYVMTTGMDQSFGGLNGVRAISDTMIRSFQAMVEVFMKRFDFVFHQLRMTFFRVMTSMDRIWSIAINSVWQAMALTNAIFSTVDLIIKIVIIILVILLALLFFLFLFAWPLVPLILSTVAVVAAAGSAAAVGGMSGSFCFDPATPVRMRNGTTKPITAVSIGDELADGCGKVTATLRFQTGGKEDLFELRGVRVTGWHVVLRDDSVAVHVQDHPEARRVEAKPATVYCLNTTSHRIPAGPEGLLFADWEELEDDDAEALLRWNREVFESLNVDVKTAKWSAERAVTGGEAVFHRATQIRTPSGPRDIGSLRPGDVVLDAEGAPTRVVGCVDMAAASVGSADRFMGSGVWVQKTVRGPWEQVGGDQRVSSPWPWISIFTESGTFMLDNGWGCRDFSDVGLDKLEKTYTWVLEEITASL